MEEKSVPSVTALPSIQRQKMTEQERLLAALNKTLEAISEAYGPLMVAHASHLAHGFTREQELDKIILEGKQNLIKAVLEAETEEALSLAEKKLAFLERLGTKTVVNRMINTTTTRERTTEEERQL
jgi:hypothetical protein